MKLEDKIDIKIFILYLLKHIGEPLDFNTVNDMVLQDEFVGYFDFALSFSELLDSGQINEFGSDDNKMYFISESGVQTLESYEGSLLPIIRERALRSAMRLMAYNKNGNRIISRITEENNGYNLHCAIVDKEKTVFSVDMFLTRKSDAERYKANFDERAEIIYKGAKSLLSGDVNFIFDD